MKKVLVVGSGIAGITASLSIVKKHHVTLIESANQYGGLLGYAHRWNNHSFDFGTHFVSKTGLKELDDELFDVLDLNNSIEVPLLGGNYFSGTLNEKASTLNLNHIEDHKLYKDICSEFINLPELDEGVISSNSLDTVLPAKYGKLITTKVFAPILRKFFDVELSELGNESLSLFGLSRIQLGADRFLNAIKQTAYFDDILAYSSRAEITKALYPVNGVGQWISLLMDKLQASVNFSSYDSTKIVLLSKSEQGYVVKLENVSSQWEEEFEYIFWSGSPFVLYNLLFKNKYESKERVYLPKKIRLFHFIFNKLKPIDVNYFYVYDESIPIFRVTIYPSETCDIGHKITVEVFENDAVKESLIVTELIKMLVIEENSICLYSYNHLSNSGFPRATLSNARENLNVLNAIEKSFSNISIIGKAPNSFFMKDVMLYTHGLVNKVIR